MKLSKSTSEIIKSLDQKKRKDGESLKEWYDRLVKLGKKKKS